MFTITALIDAPAPQNPIPQAGKRLAYKDNNFSDNHKNNFSHMSPIRKKSFEKSFERVWERGGFIRPPTTGLPLFSPILIVFNYYKIWDELKYGEFAILSY